MQLMEMVPECFRKGPELPELLRVLGWELDKVRADLDDTLAQLRVETATWGLAEIWEPKCGIKTDLTQTLAARRAKVKTRLQGLGPSTVERIRAIAKLWTDLTLMTSEKPAEFSFTLTFLGSIAIPENFAAMRAAIAEIKPAHMKFIYKLRCKAGTMPVGAALAVRSAQQYRFELEE